MRARVLSDLHLDFQRDHGEEVAQEVSGGPHYDVMVVAGDISESKGLERALRVLAKHAKAPILYVPGNHDFWGGRIEADGSLPQAPKVDGVTILQNGVAEIEGQRFIGTTLWFPRPTNQALALAAAQSWCDYQKIERSTFDHYGTMRLNAVAMVARRFLEQEIRPGDVVITHHLPSWHSVDLKFAGAASNAFYVHNVPELLEQRGVKLWVHGHTHASVAYVMGSTRVMCNPRGYPFDSGVENDRFNPHLTVDLT